MSASQEEQHGALLRNHELSDALTRSAIKEAGEKTLRAVASRRFFAEPRVEMVRVEGDLYEVRPSPRMKGNPR